MGIATRPVGDAYARSQAKRRRQLEASCVAGIVAVRIVHEARQRSFLAMVVDGDRWIVGNTGACRPELDTDRTAGVSLGSGGRYRAGSVTVDGRARRVTESAHARPFENTRHPGRATKWPDCIGRVFIKRIYSDAPDHRHRYGSVSR